MQEQRCHQKYSLYEAFDLALREAEKGFGRVSPNPPVGCVILGAKNQLLGKGHHTQFGAPHAEIEAITKAAAHVDAKSFQGAKLIVTLEPCNHFGKTNPCTHKINALPFSDIYFGLKDPSVEGGLELMRSKGKKVLSLEEIPEEEMSLKEKHHLKQRMKNQLDVFLFSSSKEGTAPPKRPFIAIKTGCSLDGKIALPSGESRWITSASARTAAQDLRAKYDAIFVGAGTVCKDNPRLNVRREGFCPEPHIIIFDPKARLQNLEALKLFQIHSPEKITLLSSAPPEGDFHRIFLDKKNLGSSLESALVSLKQNHGLYSILCEGGGGLNSLLMSLGCVEKFYIFMDHSILGQGLSWSQNLPCSELDQRLTLGPPYVEAHPDYTLLVAHSL